VVGDPRLEVSGRIVYREVQFPLVELAAALSRWLRLVGQTGESFGFTSEERRRKEARASAPMTPRGRVIGAS